MQGTLLAFLLLGFFSESSFALDLCPMYENVHGAKVRKKLESGIPFGIQSALVTTNGQMHQKSMRLAYDLWDEIIEAEIGVDKQIQFTLKDSKERICKYLSFSKINPEKPYSVSIFFNYSSGNLSSILRKQLKKNSKGLFNIKWSPLNDQRFKRSMLIHKEINK